MPKLQAAAILAAVEDGILPSAITSLPAIMTAQPAPKSAGQDARLYGRRDARRYAKHPEVHGKLPFADQRSVETEVLGLKAA